MRYALHADTPDDIRRELLSLFQNRRLDAKARASMPNQSHSTRLHWRTREAVCEEMIDFLTNVEIHPKPTTEPSHG